MKKLKVALDVDAPVLDFYGTACERYNVDKNEIINEYNVPWLMEKLPELYNDYNFWNNLNPSSSEPITFEFDVYLTHLPKKFRNARKQNLESLFFPNKPIVLVENSEDKLKWCKENDIDVMIDDKPSTVKQFLEDGTVEIIRYVPYYFDFDNDFNLGKHYKARSYEDIQNILEVINKQYG